jgi:AraC-like DNA-binding protein
MFNAAAGGTFADKLGVDPAWMNSMIAGRGRLPRALSKFDPDEALMNKASGQRQFEALFAPTTVRSTLDLVQRRGLSPERMCKGLGFTLEELQDGAFRISYRQASLLIRRVQQALRDPALGLSVGSRQTVVSWGVPGLAMLTCQTLREAVAYIHEHQREAGAMLVHRWAESGKDIVVEVTPRSYDSELNLFLIEEAFAGAVAVVRGLVGDRFNPKRVELAYPKPAHAASYAAFFRCPVRFGAGANRLISDTAWLEWRLPGFGEFAARALREKLNKLMVKTGEHSELLEFMSTHLRSHLDEPRALAETARQFNISERTLRRRLADLNVSYRDLVDRIRYERAQDLLKRGRMTVREIGLATGFEDVRSFRRAFKRWSGLLPSEIKAGTHKDSDRELNSGPA